MLTELIMALINRLKPKGTTQINALEKIKMETVNQFELEKQRKEMDHAFKLAAYNASKERRRHHFDATITLAGHALKSAILVNGGAAIGILTFIGHEVQLPKLSRSTFALSLLLYVLGVLFAAMATGFSYAAQHCFMENDDDGCLSLKIWRCFAIGAIICSYLFFAIGSYIAYSGFVDY